MSLEGVAGIVSDCRYPRVGVSIVAYRPQAQALRRLLAALVGQVGIVVLVDNGGAVAAVGDLLDNIVIVDPRGNIGVAAGHNLALLRIFGAGCSHALLFDQDSLPQDDMIGELLRIEQGLIKAGFVVGAIGPQLVAEGNGRLAGFVRFSGWRPQVSASADTNLPVPARHCDFLITSGMFLRRDVFERVGPFAESLFIDNVDVEWCYRAASLGYLCYGAVDARMLHAIGDRSMPISFARERTLVIHNPLRIYFMTRNRLLLYRMPHVPAGWKVADFPRMVIKIVAFGLLVAPRLRYLRAALSGIVDGLKGQGGPARKPF